jgi:hypothetical protein
MELRWFRAWWSWCVIRFPQFPFQYALGERRVVWHRAKSFWTVTSKQGFFSLGLVAATDSGLNIGTTNSVVLLGRTERGLVESSDLQH